jgi:hypothetical protein
MMKKSIGYGAYDGFGYADEPQWGLFNPPQSLYKSDPTLYDSIYATNRDAEEGVDQATTTNYNRYNPDKYSFALPFQVGPRKAWKRSKAPSLYAPTGTNPHKGLTPEGGFKGYGEEEESSAADTAKAAGWMASPLIILLAIILAMKIFK